VTANGASELKSPVESLHELLALIETGKAGAAHCRLTLSSLSNFIAFPACKVRRQRCPIRGSSHFSVLPLPHVLLRRCRWHSHQQSQAPHEGSIAQKTLNSVAEMADRLLHVAGPQVGILIKTRQNAWLRISSGDPHKATAVKRSPVSPPRLPRKPILNDGLRR